jgi:hypothetical protein
VAGREGGVKRRKRILLEQPKVFTSIFFKETKHCLGVQKGNKEMVCGMHALLCLFCFVCLATATRPAAFNLLVSNAHYQQCLLGWEKGARDLICV